MRLTANYAAFVVLDDGTRVFLQDHSEGGVEYAFWAAAETYATDGGVLGNKRMKAGVHLSDISFALGRQPIDLFLTDEAAVSAVEIAGLEY